jgi:hypothetical protein
MTTEEMEKLLTKFDEFQYQATFQDTNIHIEYVRAYDYFADVRPGEQDKRSVFANFVAGYLKAKRDAKQGNLL